MKKNALLIASIGLLTAGIVMAQVDRPLVEMSVTQPNGQTKTLSAPAYEVATTTLADGTEYGFTPRVIDSKPWTHVVVGIFRMGTEDQYTRELGEVDLTEGGPAATSKTTPSFKIAITKVAPPPNGS